MRSPDINTSVTARTVKASQTTNVNSKAAVPLMAAVLALLGQGCTFVNIVPEHVGPPYTYELKTNYFSCDGRAPDEDPDEIRFWMHLSWCRSANKTFQVKMEGKPEDFISRGCVSWELLTSCGTKKKSFSPLGGNYRALFEKRVTKRCKKKGGKLSRKEKAAYLRFKCTLPSRKQIIWLTSIQ